MGIKKILQENFCNDCGYTYVEQPSDGRNGDLPSGRTVYFEVILFYI